MKLTIRAGLVGLAATIALAGCGKKEEQAPAAAAQAPAAAPAEEKVVNVYNWSDYIDPKMLEAFTKETGIKVNYDVFDSNEVLQTKLLAGNTGYDVVVPSASFLELQIKAGVFQKLDQSQAAELAVPRQEHPGARGAPRPGQPVRGEPHVGHRRHRLQRQEGQGDRCPRRRSTAGSWCSIPHVASKFKDCGISILDAPDEVVGIVLAYLGKDPNSENLDDLKAAEDGADEDPPVHPHHQQLRVHQRARERRDLRRRWAGAATSCRPRPRAEEAKQGVEIGLLGPQGRHDHLVRHVRDPGGRAAPGERPRLHQLHDEARGGRGELELRALRQRQCGLGAAARCVGARRPGRLSAARDDGEAASRTSRGRRSSRAS